MLRWAVIVALTPCHSLSTLVRGRWLHSVGQCRLLSGDAGVW